MLKQIICLLPLIALIAGTYCPYCQWNACSLAMGSLPNCTACYDSAALILMQVPRTANSPAYGPIGICQPCPTNCNKCQYAYAVPSYEAPHSIVNCTSCQNGYITHHYTGKCQLCPSNCYSCQFQVLAPANSRPYAVISCTNCHPGFTQNYMSGQCLACPESCLACQCMGGMGCPTIGCTSCKDGYTLNATDYECITIGSRLLHQE